ncbi:MAG TPA: preprotein translocase subunit SecG [bacterium]|nr:preprotein translocase subunit SecG [bacterium]
MIDILSIVLLVTSVILGLAIILQPKSEGLSLMGGSSSAGAKFEKRGAELVLHRATIVFAAVFTILSVVIYLFG